ncbi:Dynein heavy chain family protein [Trichomonas vaginalis G3]|uniref:Dynein heavy chain family protein n=1 Tax=Trichomonas vaginalis (strain ATCC PRA-98 / G3) TaxID=412133 RepID=A2EXP6_TRIV3|nr:dynein light chain binding [Trichomonas vaginalis G3]EAY02556.1 Dynein heavy chain family protein [Trichomonas vaginalis G3]KAI5552053.1 dynein light chain binding [Trichomonas vaginalis G3]|eukprot:XP_001314795.1 Dynein heavy chain family protein [Trichomonas vaginalis G3]
MPKVLKPKNSRQLAPGSVSFSLSQPVPIPRLITEHDKDQDQTFLTTQNSDATSEIATELPNITIPSPTRTSNNVIRPATAIMHMSATKPIQRSKPPTLIPLGFKPLSEYQEVSRPTTKQSKTKSVLSTEPPDVTKNPIFRLKKSNLEVQIPEDLERFKLDPIYTPDISDELWLDPSLIFNYIRLIRQKRFTEEFLYFVPTPETPHEPQNVFFLRYIPPDQIDKDHYYTLSADGITSYSKESNSEFIPLDQWIRECSLFLRTKQIGFFNHYDKWRSFYLLHTITRNANINKSKQHVSDKLFNGDTIIREALIVHQKNCQQLLKLSLVDVKSAQTLTLDQFIERQKANKVAVSQEISKLLSQTTAKIISSCDLTYENAGGSKGEEETYRATKKDMMINVKAPKQKKIGSNDMMVYTQLATQRFCYKRLSRFIRLCDYILIRTLYQFIIQSAQQLLDFLKPRAGSTGGDNTRLSTQVIIENNKLAFAPNKEQMIDSVSSIWVDLMNLIYSIPLFSSNQSLLQYAQAFPWENPAIPLPTIINRDALYQNLVSQFTVRIETAFAEGEATLKEYTHFLESYIRNTQEFNIDKLHKQDPPPSFYADSLANYKQEIHEMDQIKHSVQVNMLLILLGTFADKIKPSPRNCMQSLHILIPTIAEQKVEDLTNYVNEALSTLKQDPAEIHFFVTQFEFRKRMVSELPTIQGKYKDYTAFYNLIAQNNINISEQSGISYRELGNLITQLEGCLISMKEEEDNKIKKWSPEITKLLQKLTDDLLALQQDANNEILMSAETNSDQAISNVQKLQERLAEMKQRAEQVQHHQRVLGLKISPIDQLDEVDQNINLKTLLWESYKAWNTRAAELSMMPFKKINNEELTEELDKYTRITSQLNNGLPDHPLVKIFRRSVQDYNAILPVIIALSNDHLTPNHWTKIKDITGINFQEKTPTLQFLFQNNIAQHVEPIESISNDASQEASLRRMLAEIIMQWDVVEFPMVPHQYIKDFWLVGNLDDVIAKLDESQVKLSTIRSSRYVGAIKREVDTVSTNMNNVAKCLEYITQFQIAFNSLYKIFRSSDIQHELATETRDLSTLEREYKKWGTHARDSPKPYKLFTQQKAVPQLEEFIEVTNKVQKKLEEFLQTKRTGFPRFYFLSNENLIKIFAESRNPKAVNPFLPKLFEGISLLNFSQNDQDVQSMQSAEGEVVPLIKCKFQIGAVEVGMSSVEKAMYMTMHAMVAEGHKQYEQLQRTKWISRHSAQVISVVSQIYFAETVEEILSSQNPIQELEKYKEKQEAQLRELADLVRTPLASAMRSGIVALITLDVHSRDIVSELIDKKVSSVNDFEWLKRLRYVWDAASNRVQVHQGTNSIDYGYEYLGATSRLVVTPLTERCYLTLTSAAQYFLGGSPAGPAGTGKTETVKDLSKAVGNFCVVFNCSDAVTVIQMEAFFSGLAQSGAWACFDEFNRINSEVLSVIAEQVYAVQAAQAAELQQFNFCGHTITLNPRASVFITMNPGYAGRTELPDNLKSLFRPIAMMVPDYAMIAEVVLYSEGFNNAKVLAQKVTQLYKLSSEMLSQQSHYDFGMRALKSVLVMAGATKRRTPQLSEDIILIRSMRDSNLSKLLIDDTKLFDAIIGDLFPGVTFENEQFTEVSEAIEKAVDNFGLQHSAFLTKKTIQLYQTIFIRHGVMLVGPTGGGKTTSRNLLAGALEVMGTKVDQKELNPKSVTLTELYGAYNLSTGDWKNGLVGIMFTQCADAPKEQMEWIIFDGPVDALWIENMNTVLDDNKLLSLANSDRIKMTDQMHIIFEVGDLVQASPATVSRCGMVYYQPSDLGWKPLVNAWIAKKPENVRSALTELFEKTFDNALNTLRDQCQTVVKPTVWNLAQSLCSIFDVMVSESKLKLEELAEDIAPKGCAHIFAFAMCWAFSGIITDSTRGDFDTFLRDVFQRRINYPPRRMLMDYSLDVMTDTFTAWSDQVPEPTPNSAVIPTSDTLRFSTMFALLIKAKRPVLFLGESGCGKTSIIQETLNKNIESLYSIQFTLSARTSAAQIQELIESKMQSKRKNLYGPPEGKSAVLLVDDFSMPQPDEYWSQPPIEILRQVISKKGMYNRDELYWTNIADLTVVAAGITQGHVSDRFMSQLTILSIPAPTDNILGKIFGTILSNFLKSAEFSDNVVKLSEDIVKTSVIFYRKIKSELLPTPSKAHYTFNLRDVSRVFKGICMTNPNSLFDMASFVKLWFHESLRVYGDRLVDNKDREHFQQILYDTAKQNLYLKEDIGHYFGESPLIWTDVLKGYGYEGKLNYTESLSIQQVTNALSTFSATYRTPIVLFKEAMQHALRLVRVLRQPYGHALLVGMGSTGKRTIARFAAHVARMDIFEPQPMKGYDITQFRNDLRGLFKTAGAQDKPIMFLLTDDQIVSETFLEDINNVLNTGEVPGLFQTEEYDQMVNDLIPLMKKLGESPAYDSLCRKFSSNIMKNLHVVLALSPVGGRFRDRVRVFPSLVSCCTIDWYDSWPSEALNHIANEFLSKMDLSTYGDVKKTIADMATYAHTLCLDYSGKFLRELNRMYYVTPAVYIEFFNLFTTMLEKRSASLMQEKEQLEKGVEKLQETNEKVQEMEAQLTKLRPQLQEKAVKTEQLLATLQVDREKVNEVHRVISAEEETVKKVQQKAAKLAQEAEVDLAKAMPFLENAKAAVEDLKNRKSDLAVVKSFVKPPQLVIEVMEAVCLILGEQPDWSTAKTLLAGANFLNRLLDVNKNAIPEQVLMKIRVMEADPRFEMKKVIAVSESAACLFKWVTAIEKYVTEYANVRPKQLKLEAANEAKEKAEANLAVKQKQLQEITEKLTNLQQQYDDSRLEQKELAKNIEQCEYRLKNASQLTSALDSERVRWSESLVEVGKREKCLLGDTILIALHVAYIGPFSYPYRQAILQDLQAKFKEVGVPITENFSLEGVASSPLQLREWQIQGLPQDSLSNQNGVLVTSTRRWPLMIDPQGQGRKWIIGQGNVKIIRTAESNYAQSIENAIRLGSSIFVEDITEQIDGGLQFIINPKMKKQGGRSAIRIGDKWVDYDPNFKLYMTTRLSNPQFLPDVFIQLSVINFSVTHEGLEEQLLSDVVLHEMPELEKQRSQLIVDISKDQKALQGLMQQILNLLFTSTGNILDNETLIKTLHDAKDTSKQVSARLAEAEKTEKEITEKREVYRCVATRGSLLYFVILELSGIDNMYQYSLEFFKRIFKNVLDSAQPSEDYKGKCDYFINRITKSSFLNVSRGLFANHRLVFSFLIAVALLKSTGKITEEEWRVFVRGPPTAPLEVFPAKPDNVTERVWQGICNLSQTDAVFSGIPQEVISNYDKWKPFIEDEDMLPPEPFTGLSAFTHVIMCLCMCKRKLAAMARMLVQSTLGETFVSQTIADLSGPFDDTSNDTPLLFILSQGADPRDSLERLAKSHGVSQKLSILSLGQGRGPTATSLIQNAKVAGDWVFLQNCHLCPSFLPNLEQLVQEMARTSSKYSQQFRLFLSSMPTDVFPISILRNSVKVTSEPPRGIKSETANLLQTLTSEDFERSKHIRPFKKLVYSLALFHSTIQERKQYGALGFNKVYEWSTSDFQIATMMLRNFVSDYDEVPWSALLSTVGDVVYGGRVTDDWDRRCMNTMLKKFICEQATMDNIYFDPLGHYASPPLENLEKTIEFTNGMPDVDIPDIFGLHSSAQHTLDLNRSDTLHGLVVSVQPKDSNSAAASKDDEIVLDMAEKFDTQLPFEINLKNADEALMESLNPKEGRPNSLSVVLMQEVDRFNNLLKLIHSSLKQVSKAIKGEVVMTVDIQKTYRSLLEGKVPHEWSSKAYPSTKPIHSWFKDLLEKVGFIQHWVSKGQPTVFWFPGFFFPQSFLTAVLQSHSRKHKLPIDALSFKAEVIERDPDTIVQPPEDGVYIQGLFFDGCRWDSDEASLADVSANVEYSKCPVLHLIPTTEHVEENTEDYMCPVYRTSERAGVLSTTGHSTNFVVALNIPSAVLPDKWILRGAALLTATPY